MFSTAIKQFLNRNNYPEFSPKAVFFDMDGVLFDSMPAHVSAWVKALNESGFPFTEHEAYMYEGQTGHATINAAFKQIYKREATEKEKQDIYSIKTKYFEKYPQSEPMPFAFELLNKIKAKGLDIYLVTGSGQASLLDNLQHFFPDIFVRERMITAFDVNEGKPAPEPYLKALAKSGYEPHQICVIENAPLGIKSAHDAGLFSIGVNTGILKKDDLFDTGANIVLDSMQELYEKWDEIFLIS